MCAVCVLWLQTISSCSLWYDMKTEAFGLLPELGEKLLYYNLPKYVWQKNSICLWWAMSALLCVQNSDIMMVEAVALPVTHNGEANSVVTSSVGPWPIQGEAVETRLLSVVGVGHYLGLLLARACPSPTNNLTPLTCVYASVFGSSCVWWRERHLMSVAASPTNLLPRQWPCDPVWAIPCAPCVTASSLHPRLSFQTIPAGEWWKRSCDMCVSF